jgi:hypothetical protein
MSDRQTYLERVQIQIAEWEKNNKPHYPQKSAKKGSTKLSSAYWGSRYFREKRFYLGEDSP